MRRTLFGWQVPGGYCLSKVPPDLPQLPRDVHPTIDAAEGAAMKRKAVVVWCGPALAEKARLEAA
ncbi:MAG TPA: hypothetical protein VKX28_26865 [Xanthobacteraceae bacterium]|nr:hypothetical protein [Xanthobacteraceae bacterium]